MQLTHTEENYLKAIYQVSESKSREAGTNELAHHLSTSAASVSDMLKKLSDKKLIQYKKYKGVSLSKTGLQMATLLIRKHRLWETFLVNTLEFGWAEVHDIAEQLEHVKSDQLINKLEAFLDYPKYDPHGDPIPNAEGLTPKREQFPLASIQINEKIEVIHVLNDEESFLHFLDKINIQLGTKLLVTAKLAFDQSMQFQTEDKQLIHLTSSVCEQIMVKKLKA